MCKAHNIIEPFFGMYFLGSLEKLIGVTEVSNNFDTSCPSKI